ncbi:hypothetical protein O988_06956, partial [Pseudogymnoascus sp. VKM F-3808]
DHRALVPSYNI